MDRIIPVMDDIPSESLTPLAAAQNLLDTYKKELSRLEGTKKGLENKIASTKAKIEAAEEFLVAMKTVQKKTTQ
jgi:hypothetical protein